MGVSMRTSRLRMYGGRAIIVDDEPLPQGRKFGPRQARSLPKDRSLRQMPRVVFRQVCHQLQEGRCGRERRVRLHLTCGVRMSFGGCRGSHTPCRVRHHQHR